MKFSSLGGIQLYFQPQIFNFGNFFLTYYSPGTTPPHMPKTPEVCFLPHAQLDIIFFFSFVSFNLFFIFSKEIFNFFCVDYIDGISGGILTLHSLVSITPFLYVSILSLHSFRIFLNTLPPATLYWSKPLLELFMKLRFNGSVFKCLCLQ